MRIIYTFVLNLTLIVNCIECSSHTGKDPDNKFDLGSPARARNLLLLAECCSHTDGDPDSEHNVTSSSSSPGKQHSPERAPARKPYRHDRSRSPTYSPAPIKVLGYSLKQLGYIRLIPRGRENLRFEFRSYVFTPDKPYRLLTERKRFTPVPIQKQIVVAASNGDIFAVLELSGFLRGIYKAQKHNPRIKINMISGDVDYLTLEEKLDCPVGNNHPVFPNSFIEAFADHDSLQFEQNLIDKRNPSSSRFAREHSPYRTIPQVPPLPDRSRSPPGRPPSNRVLGFSMKKLGFIRLIPRANQNRQFEFRRYVIDANKPIRLQARGDYFWRVPNQENIVLSTSAGEVFALLEYTGILRGIHKADKDHTRVKINMMNGSVGKMTAIEMSECHVGENYPIFPRWFKKVVAHQDSLLHVYQ